jgi:penicillin-binding protein activator
MNTKWTIIYLVLPVLVWGCTPETKNIDTQNDEGKAVLALDYRDFDKATTEMVQSMLSSGVFKKADGSRYVVATSRVLNDTQQRIDTEQLTFKIEQELMNSGQVTMTAAVGGKGAPDPMVQQSRDLRDSEKSDEFKGDTLPGKGKIIAPELSISGKIFQRNVRYDNDLQQIEYYFQLRVADLSSGLVQWQKETLIGKRGSKKVVPW